MKKLFFVLFLILSTAGNIIAQKTATIKSFTQTADHISGNDRRKDLNGNLCALVKVQVIDNIERVEGNKIGNIVKHGVENWVYMCKGSRNMRIHLQNHLPVKVVFQDYSINGLESNRVYELVIEIPDAPAPEQFITTSNSSAQQKLTLNYTPEHAMVLIDSKPYRGNGKIELQLPVGEHDYIIAAEGYITAEATVKLTEYAPRTITEMLSVDEAAMAVLADNVKESSNIQITGSKNKKLQGNNRQTRKQDKSKKVKITAKKDSQLKDNGQPKSQSNDNASQSKKNKISTPKRFSYFIGGVTFRCKVNGGTVTITGFDVKAKNVEIPSLVRYKGVDYYVTAIDTHVNGNNYRTENLVIPEGVEIIENYAFAEFRKLKNVTIPSSVIKIGKNAFRNNLGMVFNISAGIDENMLRAGKEITTR